MLMGKNCRSRSADALEQLRLLVIPHWVPQLPPVARRAGAVATVGASLIFVL